MADIVPATRDSLVSENGSASPYTPLPISNGMTSEVSLEGVSFSYPNGVKALESVELTVPRAHTVSIVGPSGCGKSTLLAIVAGLTLPTSGTVTRCKVEPGRLPVTMVSQKETLLPWLKVKDQVGLHFRLRRQHKTERVRAWVQDLLDLVGLGDFQDAYPYQLSGGMRRRVAFLTAVAPIPQVLLLDEPFSSVDEPTRLVIHQDVFDITRQYEITTVLVTHDLAEAMSLSDEVIILSRGPGRVAAVHTMPFGPERDIVALREQPEFLELYGKLWRELGLQLDNGGRKRQRSFRDSTSHRPDWMTEG
ncbi:MAG TPA: ABC transporter ATP-binding protein [Acidimicrobiales bacterium]|nr:ABC transporter ATP-binding protein [Acidimicrobiales bacterium]